MSNAERGFATMTTRAVFLDIDGVFHPSTAIEGKDPAIPMDVYAKDHDLLRWTPVLAEMLQGHEDVMLFVHSNWRTAVSNATLRELLGPLGRGRLFQGVTDVNVRDREPSIKAMVNQAQIDHFLILDDAHKEFTELSDNLVVCNPLMGVSDPEVQAKVRVWLNKTAPQKTVSAGVH